MKPTILLLTLLSVACTKQADHEAEKSAITKLIDDETRYAAAADSASWKKYWRQTDESLFTITGAEGTQQFQGWNAIQTGLTTDAKPFNLKIKRDNYQYTIGNDVAFVSFDQEDNWGGSEDRKTKETRTLRKVDGEWKIVNLNVIDVSSFEKANSPSYHIAKENIPVGMKAPKTILRSKSGLGGMTAAYNELPAGSDMSPLFEGLPGNSCTAPHWGYILEGAIRIKYVDGKEELVKAGEIFYWPAGHLPFVEKDVKLIDFSPEAELNVVLAHIAKKMEQQPK
ncbi:MAG: hypothetical protein WD824_17325 [Cyclobacteriaceae bacterium]